MLSLPQKTCKATLRMRNSKRHLRNSNSGQKHRDRLTDQADLTSEPSLQGGRMVGFSDTRLSAACSGVPLKRIIGNFLRARSGYPSPEKGPPRCVLVLQSELLGWTMVRDPTLLIAAEMCQNQLLSAHDAVPSFDTGNETIRRTTTVHSRHDTPRDSGRDRPAG
jgi:hypothetical protein